jgi:2-hydroxychromene-2-carboxylate isomerase
MTRAPAQGGARLTVCIDFKSPFAYLAMQPTYALEDELREEQKDELKDQQKDEPGISIDWQPLIVAPMTEPTGVPEGADRGARHRHLRRQYVARDVLRYAEVRGLRLGNIFRAPDSSIAAMGLLFCKKQPRDVQRRYMDLVFEGYGSETLDIEDPLAIATALSEAGMDADGFEAFSTDVGPGALADAQQDLLESGIGNAPAYLLGDEVFIGRQHLPMIRWLLMDRQGPPPI